MGNDTKVLRSSISRHHRVRAHVSQNDVASENVGKPIVPISELYDDDRFAPRGPPERDARKRADRAKRFDPSARGAERKRGDYSGGTVFQSPLVSTPRALVNMARKKSKKQVTKWGTRSIKKRL